MLQRSPRLAPPADPRIAALRRFALSITVFNILGHFWLGFEQAYLTPLVGLFTAYLLELGLETLKARSLGLRPRFLGRPGQLVSFLLPAHITGLACAMLLYGNQSVWPTVFAVTVAIGSKYVLRVRVGGGVRHVLNPSNLGIVTTLLLFHWVSIAPPYQFTEYVPGPLDVIIPLLVLAAGTMLNAKLTRRGPLILGWLAGFVLQAVLRWLFLDMALVSGLLVASGFAFVLFTNYMITDPGTTPSRPSRQVVFGASVALAYGALVALHIAFGLFFALVAVCVARTVVLLVAERVRRGQPVPVPAATAEPAAVGGRPGTAQPEPLQPKPLTPVARTAT
jgi:hypothetical protein